MFMSLKCRHICNSLKIISVIINIYIGAKGSHQLLWNEVKGNREHWRMRWLKESVYILGIENFLNRPSIETDKIWEPLIKKEKTIKRNCHQSQDIQFHHLTTYIRLKVPRDTWTNESVLVKRISGSLTIVNLISGSADSVKSYTLVKWMSNNSGNLWYLFYFAMFFLPWLKG